MTTLNKKLTPDQVKNHFSKLYAPLSLENANKVDELKDYFSKQISQNHNAVDALPIIDVIDMMITEYQQVYGWIEEGYKRFILKGSRGSAKTTFAVQFIIIDMLIEPQSSWFCIMDNKVQHSDTTMLEFKEWIDRIDMKWLGFSNKWEKSDGQSIKEWRFKHNGNYQKIKFIGLDEAKKGTITPPSGNFWRGFWIEEVAASDEQFGADMETKKMKFDALNTLRASSSRFFNRCKDKVKRSKLRFLEIWTFNPYNDDEPALENFNKYLPDNVEKLMRDGWDHYKNEELKEVYMTTNYLINPYLPEDFIELMQTTAKNKVGAWKTICYGITGSPINTVFSNIFHIMDKQQTQYNWPLFISKGYTGFKQFFITIDIGNGGEGETAMILFGRRYNGQDVPLREFGTRKYIDANGYDVEKEILLLWNEISLWTNHFVDIKQNTTIPILIDFDKTWKVLFSKGHSTFKGKGLFKIKMFDEKYKTAFKQEKRPGIVRYLISTEQVIISKELTPMLWKQLRSLSTNKNGKIQEKGIDLWDSFAQRIYHKAREVGLHRLKEGKLLDKDMLEFIRNT